jgi:hypothetical protein
MTLPKIQHPTFKIVVPSTKKQLLFRPFLVKEEKILLIAKVGEDSTDILSAIKQVVNNCCEEKNFNINKLTIFDIEYIFLKIRANSVSNKVNLTFKDLEDEKEYTFEIDLNTVEVEYPKNVDNRIIIDEKVGIIMKYPSASIYDDKDFMKLGKDSLFELIIRCIDKIYKNDEMFDTSSYTRDELIEFLDNLNVNTFEKIQQFLTDSPTMRYVINYKNSLGNDRKIELTTLTDFFTLR